MLRAMIDSQSIQRFLFFSMLAVALTMMTSFVVVRTVLVYRLSTEQAQLKARMDSLVIDVDSHMKTLQERLDVMDRTLYAAPTVKAPPPRRSSSIEAWIVNKNNEQDAKIKALEQWRYRMER